MSDLLSVIKQAALEAVREAGPVEILNGIVEAVSPLKIRIDQKTLLDEDFLILNRETGDYEIEATCDGIKRKYTVHNALKPGEKCILLSIQGSSDYLVLCRLEVSE